METMCSHSVHQASDLRKSTQYEIALAVIGSLMEDCRQAGEELDEVTSSATGGGYHDRYAQGEAAAYRSMLGNLQSWQDALLKG